MRWSVRHAASDVSAARSQNRSRSEDAHGQKRKQNLLGGFSIFFFFFFLGCRTGTMMLFLVDYFQWRINTQLASGFCVQMGLNPPWDISIHFRESVETNPQLSQSETVAAEEHWDVQPKRCCFKFAPVCFILPSSLHNLCFLTNGFAPSANTLRWLRQRFGSNNLKSSTLYEAKPPALIAWCVAADWVSSRSVHDRSEKLLSIPEM